MNTKSRKSIRLKEYDYSTPGEYFVTICSNNHKCVFGEVLNEEMKLSDKGIIVKQYWGQIPRHFPNVILDEYIIMPNHIHGIIVLNEYVVGTRHAVSLQERFGKPIPNSLSTIVRSFKSAVTKRINEIFDDCNDLWQSRYYEHIIRNEKDLLNIRDYIINNPHTRAFLKKSVFRRLLLLPNNIVVRNHRNDVIHLFTLSPRNRQR